MYFLLKIGKDLKSEINFLFQLITNYFKTELKMVCLKELKLI